MGLPLFIAPVESDIKTKSPEKSITRRRQARVNVASRAAVGRERRALQRRAAILRESFPTPGPEPHPDSIRPWASISDEDTPITAYPPPPPPPPFTSARYPWIESGQPPPPEAYDSGSAIGRSTTQRPSSPFASATYGGESLRTLLGDGYPWSNRYGHASGPPPLTQSPQQADSDSFRRDRIAPSVAARFDRSPERSLRTRAGRNAEAGSSAQSRSRSRRQRLESTSTRRANAMDGLGDRSRSLSPEVWDTLLTTLTPDPQPPSVGSSFASASASNSQSQSAAASSRTSLGPDTVDPTLTEVPCDNSDSDYEPTDDEMSLRPDHLSTNVPSRHRRFVAALDSNENRSTSYVRGGENRLDRAAITRNRFLSGLRRRHLNPDDFTEYESVVSQTRRLVELGNRLREDFTSMMDDRERQAAEERGGDNDATGVREAEERDDDTDRADASENPRGTDERAWDGMWRIVRNLAAREDIPDEWWAEAGLSRTVSDDA